VLWHAHEQQRHAGEFYDRMVNGNRRVDCVATQIGQGIGDVRYRRRIDALRLTVVSNAKYEAAAIGMICCRDQVLCESLLVLGEAHLPVQFVHFMRHRHEAFRQTLLSVRDPVLFAV
jgi:hypothetical protein